MSAPPVLVTGAGGFIGSHLAEALVREGYRVRTLLRYTSKGSRGWLDAIEPAIRSEIDCVFGDVRDAQTVRQAARDCRRIYHLAALIGIPYSYDAPDAYVQTNVAGTANVLDAARELGDRLERVVVTSTSECYGTARHIPIAEDHVLQAQSPYAASKIAADKLAESYYCSFGLRVVTVRPFNAFGPRQSTRAVIPTIVTQCLSGQAVRLGNISTTRDLTYVADTVRAFVLAGASREAEGRVINVGTGREVSIEELYRLISDRIGNGAALEIEAARVRPSASEVERLVADNTLARDLLGWTPQTSLEVGLDRTIAWIRENLEQYRVGGYHR